MTRGDVAFGAASVAFLLAVLGLIALIGHTAVVEALCVEVAGLTVAVIAAALFFTDGPGSR